MVWRVLNTPVSVTGNQTISSLGLPNIASGSGNSAMRQLGTASYSVFSWVWLRRAMYTSAAKQQRPMAPGEYRFTLSETPVILTQAIRAPGRSQGCGKVANAQDSYSTFGLNGILRHRSFHPGLRAQVARMPCLLRRCDHSSAQGSSCGSGVTVVTSNQCQIPSPGFRRQQIARAHHEELQNITDGSGGANEAIGSSVFGIGTQANNTLGSAQRVSYRRYWRDQQQPAQGSSTYSGSYVDTRSSDSDVSSSSTFASLLGGNPLPA